MGGKKRDICRLKTKNPCRICLIQEPKMAPGFHSLDTDFEKIQHKLIAHQSSTTPFLMTALLALGIRISWPS